MSMKNLFQKPVDRPIEGVIKADDEATLRQELEEYVLTREVEKRLGIFLDAYNNYEGANGVWVSGFFGSGKSHLLKMLALVLENREVDGKSAMDYFLPKCGDNEILRGDLKKTISIPSRSILFNIDQKADVISKKQIDALLSVFVKVFDEMCGYYGKQGHIAQFERDLDSRKKYEDFKSAYNSISGLPWERGREQALLEGPNISKAYAEVTGSDSSAADGILDKYRSEYKVSIEDFAEAVQAYIERQVSGFRLNFLVDEVGQYIADNIKLMTNLQTIAESLATKCRGRAWVIVTAQEDMDSVLGEMGKQQSNDFTKIQARFNNRMKLTSSDVAEVIQKRLLLKNDEGVELLSEVYHKQVNNFKTLFTFVDGSKDYKLYNGREHFIHSYPFIPYQFTLFQTSIQNLSLHSAFEGKHSSVGERSMLGVFQQVAIQIGDSKVGQLATFDLMFEGIRTALKSQIQSAISQVAEKQLDNKFAVRLLKALFLVKYVKEFKTTVRNICVLMRESFEQDTSSLQKQVEEALNLLEQQTYIQRNGDCFEYLSDEEKNVEQEIKNTDVEADKVAEELEKLLFDGVLKTRKIRYDDNGHDYSFTRKLDDKLFGRESELSIHIVSPFHEKAGDEETLTRNSWGRSELLVLLPADDRLIRDLLMYKRTEKYIKQNISVSQQEAVQRILSDKGYQNRERLGEIQERVKYLMGKAKLFVAGTEIETSSEEGQTRVTKGFQVLVSRVYPNLRMLRGANYSEEQVHTILNDRQNTLDGLDVTSLSEAEQELYAFIQGNQNGGVRTTLKSLIEKFEKKPYGWYYASILCLLAKICVRGKVELKIDGNILDENEQEKALRNTHTNGNVVLEPQEEFTASQIRALKEFYEDFFDSPASSKEAKALGKETEEAFRNLLKDLYPLTGQTSQYLFLTNLSAVVEELKEAEGKPYTWFLKELVRKNDHLLDLKEGIIDPIRKFMAGPQKEIYDAARELLINQKPNLEYGFTESAEIITAILHDTECYKGNKIQQLKVNVEELKAGINEKLQTEISKAVHVFQALLIRFKGMDEFQQLPEDRKNQLIESFSSFQNSLKSKELIAGIRDSLRRFEEGEYSRLLSSLSKPEEPTGGSASPTEDSSETPDAIQIQPQVISRRSILVDFDKAWLADEGDVESYLDALRKALLEEIKKGKRIQI
ncbi:MULTISPECIES: BREX system P-loop protein BrxC [unclassified Oceanispirochaeta]|uniref:BREX system P-loop protein BrxC n=1 Tax=unclassified Oceanispirochaeta TaxID=2635722 RepID=UPI000E09D4DB|nr:MULTISPECIES: BREX system P-loop protein BrxC [unclassified Oceanispirochaeta]MBF9015171.1 BREX system P-loop protein BrxC [Oceanispirochaeta sp. M2]NPD71629.1 BREX system P-loop protein BrxC [Oceanispirochaeta sp. M1]RDG33196.1 BREX system P-loop protein BrxC [Oceanispirochaeta sp. M1]